MREKMSVRRSLIACIGIAIVLLTPGAAFAGGTVPDTNPPLITLTTPPDGATYQLNQSVLASSSCFDFESGLSSCVGEVPNGSAIDTDDLGEHLFTVNALDNAGNPASRTHLYYVVAAPEGKPDARIRRT